ncbi:MAG: UDP-N-acetylglucosamine 1-carboxyvinyltransferase [Candidatus Omnitrophota bacterium]
MDKFVIEGGVPLKGEVKISGAKNAVLPILAATLLTDKRCIIKNVPRLADVFTMLRILNALGMKTNFSGDAISVEPGANRKYIAPYRLVRTMRASFCVLGPLLARLKKAEVSLPGGCIIGVRPVDLHLKGLSALGVDMDIEAGYVKARVKKNLKAGYVYLGGQFGSSVLATANVMMAAVFAKGKTVLESCACEPEVLDLANFLKKMGAKITGEGTPHIEIEGVSELKGAEYFVIPDRIEAGTFIIAAAITRGQVVVKNFVRNHLSCIIDKLQEAGLNLKIGKDYSAIKSRRTLKPVNVTTLPFPGFPTDMQAQFMSLMAITPGVSVISEKVYPDRFMHIAELNRMGAHIQREGPHAIVQGVRQLQGAPVMASDLRASAALILAGLVAKGKTEVFRIYHLDRGYEDLDKKLVSLGARVWREKE